MSDRSSKARARKPATTSCPPRRSGYLLVIMVVLLTVAGILTAAMVQSLAGERRRLELHERRLQADWLVESGLQRAVARLRAEPDYAGERWEIPATQLEGREPAVVTIEIIPVAGSAGFARARVEARLGGAPAYAVRREKELRIQLAP